ncbi:MAG: proline--tRNA ligase [Candidatus Micrarchaeia archaeon]
MQLDKSNFSEWFSQVVEQADIIDIRYPVKGMPIYKGWGYAALRACFNLLEEKLNASGHQQMLFPLLIPEDQFGKEAEHIAGFADEVMWATHAGLERMERKLAVRPTSETVMYPMFALWIRSHADLPLRVHQTCCVYRYDTKTTRPLIRGREIFWNEAHCVHASEEDAEKQIREAFRIYSEFYAALGVPFLALRRPEHDKFPGAAYSIALDVLMPDGKVLQAATIHNLGENFSRVYSIEFDDEKGGKHFAKQTTYGISMRCLAAVIAVHGDNKGLVLPPAIAPVQAVIVPILSAEKGKEALEACRKIEDRLRRAGIRVALDEREVRPGEKFYHWEGRGVPVRIEVGPKDVAASKAVVALRTGEKKSVPQEEIVEEVRKAFETVLFELRKKAEAGLRARLSTARNTAELKKAIEKAGGFVKAGWCGEVDCANAIQEATTAEVRGTEFGKPKEKSVCIHCGKEGFAAWFAKAY